MAPFFKHDLGLMMSPAIIFMHLIVLCLFAWLIFFTVLNMCIVMEASFFCVRIELINSLWHCKAQSDALSQQFVKMAAPMTGILHYFRRHALNRRSYHITVYMTQYAFRENRVWKSWRWFWVQNYSFAQQIVIEWTDLVSKHTKEFYFVEFL